MESYGPRPIVLRRTIAMLLVFVASHTGLATLPAASQTSSAPSDEMLQSLRTIGAIGGSVPREATLTPRTPAGEAAWIAAAKGAKVTFQMALELCRGMGLKSLVACPVAAAFGAGLARVGAAAAATVEAIRADPTATADAAPRLLLKLLTESDVPGAIRDRVADLGNRWAQWRPWRFCILAGDGQDAGTLDPRRLDERGVDTVFQVDVGHIGLAGDRTQINPPLTLVMTVRVRLLRLPAMEVLHETSLTWEGSPLRLAQWVADDGDRLRREIGQATLGLAERIVDEVFLLVSPLDHIPSTGERVVRERMKFLRAGITTAEEIFGRLGTPARRYDDGRVLAYLLYSDRRGQLRPSPRLGEISVPFRLVLVFGRDRYLEAYRLIPLEKP